METLFGKVLQRFHDTRETGALFVTVVQSKEYMVRVWFERGHIRRVSYGPLRGKECLDLLDCYDFGKAIFFPGMKTYRASDDDIPKTVSLVADLMSTGKTVQDVQIMSGGIRQDRPAAAVA